MSKEKIRHHVKIITEKRTPLTGSIAYGIFAARMDPWCSGQTCGPVKAEIAGSNPVGSALWQVNTQRSAVEQHSAV